MRLDSIRARGVGPFTEEVNVDLSAIDGQIVAVTGENGAGKSTLLELFAGALYRKCPTRGSLVDLATARDAFVEVGVVNGKAWTLRHTLDNVSGRSEALVLRADGRPELATTGLQSFDAWRAKTLTPPDVLLSSTFSAQGSGGFLELKAGARKALLLSALGIDKLEALAASARERARSSKSAADITRARLSDARAGADDVTVAEHREQSFAKDVAYWTGTVETARLNLAALVDEEARVRALLHARSEYRRRVEVNAVCLAEQSAKIVDIEARIKNNAGVLARSHEINAAVEQTSKILAKLSAVDGEIARLKDVDAGLSREEVMAKNGYDHASYAIVRCDDRIVAADAKLQNRGAVESAERDVVRLTGEIAKTEAESTEMQRALDALSARELKSAGQRIESLRAGLDTCATAVEDALIGRYYDAIQHLPTVILDASKKALSDDDADALDAEQVPRERAEATRKRDQCATRLGLMRRAKEGADKTAAMRGTLAGAEAERVDAVAARGTALRDAAVAKEALAAATDARALVAEAVAAQQKERENLERDRAMYAPTVLQASRLTEAQARIEELQRQLEGVRATLAMLEDERAELEAAAPVEPRPELLDVEGARKLLADAQGSLTRAEAALDTAQRELHAAQVAAQTIAKFETDLATAECDLSDWTRLAADLGKDGLQAAEADCVGPTLTEMTNDLLHECHGPRFTVRIETQSVSADGKKMIEGCDVMVLDTERGREAEAETFSGGERVILSAAVSGALSMLVSQRNGIDGSTVVLDESAAALDPENARAYVAMQRRRAKLTNASKILIVTHSPEVQDLCDARIEVKDGRVTVAS